MDPKKYGHEVAFRLALITACWVGGSAALLVALVEWFCLLMAVAIPFNWFMFWIALFAVPAFAGVGCWKWLTAAQEWDKKINRIIDVNGNGIPDWDERPPADPQVVTIRMYDKTETNYIDLPVRPDQLKKFAVGIVQQKKPITTGLWVGGDDKTFTRPEFEQLRQAMIERNLAEWKNESAPNQGVDLTRQGKAAMQYLASENWYAPAPNSQ